MAKENRPSNELSLDADGHRCGRAIRLSIHSRLRFWPDMRGRAESVPATRVDVNLADFENGALRPAQLAMFTDAVPDTLILNQIK